MEANTVQVDDNPVDQEKSVSRHVLKFLYNTVNPLIGIKYVPLYSSN